tara:strand:+ start:1053 stop:2102 length:1050 start_codon:yes stop_codon:yes gene_type:complete
MVSYTNSLGIELQVTGTNSGTWGTKTNNNFELFEQAIAGYQDVSIAGGAQTTALLMSDATISNARNAVIKLSGTITGNQIVTIPNSIEKVYIISNETSGAHTVQFKTVSGTGYTFAAADKTKRVLYSDGTNIVDTGIVTTASTDTLSNKTFSGTITNSGTIVGGGVSAVTLTKPKFADAGFIADSNGNEQIIFQETASAVNELEITNAATGNDVGLAVSGGDTNVGLAFTAKGNGKFKFNDAAYFPEATLTDGATINWDVQAAPVAKVTLGGNRTFAAPTNGSTGQFVSLLIIQDGTGTREPTFNAVFEFTGDTAPTLTTTAAKGDLFVFYYNGSKFLEVGRNLNLTLS